MAFPTPTPAARAAFEAMVPMDPRVEVKPMFGNLAAFADGRMFLGVFGDAVFLRLPEGDREAIRAHGATPFGPMPERPMKEYIALPEAWHDAPAMAGEWVSRSLAWAVTLPLKPAKKRPSKAP
jgi:TfoX/Sxy family transcriptional regulator of competence genes